MGAEENIRAAVALQGRFLGFKPFPKASPDCYAVYGTPGVTVINAQEITLSSLRKPVSELIMANLWSYKTRHPKSCPLVFFLDECQNLRFDAVSTAWPSAFSGKAESTTLLAVSAPSGFPMCRIIP